MIELKLHRMRFHAYHGVYESERIEGGEFEVTVSMKLLTDEVGTTDSIEDTVDYSEFYKLVAGEMEQPSQLIEHVATRIARKLLSAFDLIENVEVGVHKLHPPIEGACFEGASALCRLSRT